MDQNIIGISRSIFEGELSSFIVAFIFLASAFAWGILRLFRAISEIRVSSGEDLRKRHSIMFEALGMQSSKVNDLRIEESFLSAYRFLISAKMVRTLINRDHSGYAIRTYKFAKKYLCYRDNDKPESGIRWKRRHNRVRIPLINKKVSILKISYMLIYMFFVMSAMGCLLVLEKYSELGIDGFVAPLMTILLACCLMMIGVSSLIDGIRYRAAEEFLVKYGLRTVSKKSLSQQPSVQVIQVGDIERGKRYGSPTDQTATEQSIEAVT